jgi:hypothetical protein
MSSYISSDTIFTWLAVPARSKDAKVALEHIKKEFAQESLDCLVAIEEFKGVKFPQYSVIPKQHAGAKAQAKYIFERFVREKAECEVNVDGKIRQKVTDQFKGTNQPNATELFDDVAYELRNTIQDALSRLPYAPPAKDDIGFALILCDPKHKKAAEAFYAYAKAVKDARGQKKDPATNELDLFITIFELKGAKTNFSAKPLTLPPKATDLEKAILIFKEFIAPGAKRAVNKNAVAEDERKKVQAAIDKKTIGKDGFEILEPRLLTYIRTTRFWNFVTNANEAISIYPMKKA